MLKNYMNARKYQPSYTRYTQAGLKVVINRISIHLKYSLFEKIKLYED